MLTVARKEVCTLGRPLSTAALPRVMNGLMHVILPLAVALVAASVQATRKLSELDIPHDRRPPG